MTVKWKEMDSLSIISMSESSSYRHNLKGFNDQKWSTWSYYYNSILIFLQYHQTTPSRHSVKGPELERFIPSEGIEVTLRPHSNRRFRPQLPAPTYPTKVWPRAIAFLFLLRISPLEHQINILQDPKGSMTKIWKNYSLIYFQNFIYIFRF